MEDAAKKAAPRTRDIMSRVIGGSEAEDKDCSEEMVVGS